MKLSSPTAKSRLEFYGIDKYHMLVGVMKMRADTCRHCGYELEALQKCLVCGKPYRFQCKSCGQQSEEQIHPGCIT